FDELTKWFGEMKLGEITDNIDSPEAKLRDILDQPYVEVAKGLMQTEAQGLSRDGRDLEQRYNRVLQMVISGPHLETTWFRHGQVQRLRDIEDLRKDYPPGIFSGEPKDKVTLTKEDEEFLRVFKEIVRLQKERSSIKDMQKVAEYDERIRGLFAQIKDYGKGPQIESIEVNARRLALLAVYLYRYAGKIPLPIFYSCQSEAEALGGWYKYIRKMLPNEYGIGTREQHSYFQTLLGGKKVVLPILVDIVSSLDQIRQTQVPISYWGLAQEYLKGLYPDEVRRLFLEAECKAFISSWEELHESIQKKLEGKIRTKTQRSCAVLRLWDLSTDKGRIEAFRFFGRFNELLNELITATGSIYPTTYPLPVPEEAQRQAEQKYGKDRILTDIELESFDLRYPEKFLENQYQIL
ncbi:MAG: hypothetical protein AAB267_01590, partial [Candidatus Desantisbacteria bacterium]